MRRSNKGMKLTKHGQLRSFAAYPRCSADVAGCARANGMITTEAAFLALVFSGVIALLASMLVTRLHWRPDIPPYSRQTRSLDVTLHPERYVKNAPLLAIRALTVIGALLVVGAAIIATYEILYAVRSSRPTHVGTAARQAGAHSLPGVASWG
jgi:hypothetical protein